MLLFGQVCWFLTQNLATPTVLKQQVIHTTALALVVIEWSLQLHESQTFPNPKVSIAWIKCRRIIADVKSINNAGMKMFVCA